MRKTALPSTLALATFACVGVSILIVAPRPAAASSPLECAPSYELDPLRLLRQVSLDLLGRPPTIEELELVRAAPDRRAAVEDAIADMLVSEAYYAKLRGYHRNLLWGSLADSIARVFPATSTLRTVPSVDSSIWTNTQGTMRKRYRGRVDVYCLDQEQTDFDAEGYPIPISTFASADCSGGTCQQEGWVWVEPYWAPGEEVKVCAYDAQDFEYGLDDPDKACSDRRTVDAGCGCGADMRYCVRNDDKELFREALAEEPARIFETVIRGDQSYLDAFRSDATVMNGPVAHYYKWIRGAGEATTGDIPYEAEIGEVPDIPFTQVDTWTPVVRGEAHAGAFTTVGYQMRFASLRGRANRFYTAFYCDPFVPSVDGLPAEEAEPSPDLRQRNGCADCHQILEPAAAHFARWRTNSAYGYLGTDLLEVDALREECVCGTGTGSNCSAFCSKYYVTADNSDAATFELYAGMPLTTAYAAPIELQNTEAGPAALIDEPAEQYAVAQCTVRTMAEHLLHRQLESTEFDWLDEQTADFVDSGYNFTTMVEALIADERYRQIH
ncbi:hypothetical protein G6O69_25465 [Pseudenhygromyxa sp. WMMC2535]|uniref:hypothetical protein n=1 Tax=Pseudenhygromyxa sp. WMMC2535 TaxID=2712867 RepID=UPI001557A2C3|nr:hypothetical protein [Pseudenhygromyxa sp. WMMC2535]NVB41213.1 hypothetical protein [Pseudenhygromyxa sp. WMMC2535]